MDRAGGVNKMDCDTAAHKQSRYGEIANEVMDMLVKVGWKNDFIVDTACGHGRVLRAAGALYGPGRPVGKTRNPGAVLSPQRHWRLPHRGILRPRFRDWVPSLARPCGSSSAMP